MTVNSSISPFRERVYRLTQMIPRGFVSTYGILTSVLFSDRDRPGICARAVGNALKRNPWAPEVPCHRVIRSDLNLGGFKGKTKGPEHMEKLNLLHSEGVLFDKNMKLKDESRVWRFENTMKKVDIRVSHP